MWTKPIAVLLICVARGTAANLFDGDERVEAPTFSALKNAKSDKPELFANKLAALASACCVNAAKDTCHTTDKCNKKEKECIKCNKKTGGYKWKVPGSGDPPSGPPPPSPPCCLVIATNTCHVEAKCNKKEKDCLKNKCQKTFVAGASGEAKWKRRNNPTRAPSNSPTTAAPSRNPTRAPSNSPTAQPTSGPTSSPTTAAPSRNPTAAPSNVPTAQPTLGPTSAPTTAAPSRNPTPAPSNVSTAQPTSGPTSAPTTAAPSSSPTHGPTTSPTTAPSKAPTAQPTLGPTSAPTTAAPSRNPTPAPSNSPTSQPTSGPTPAPTAAAPSSSPTQAPTEAPVVTGTPTAVPTSAPSNAPTSQPTSGPTSSPTTAAPSSSPTQAPTEAPVVTGTPTAVPTSAPSNAPTPQPTSGPTSTPTTAAPSSSPTQAPTEAPVTATPTTAVPTSAPSAHPTEDPTAQPTSPPTTAAPTLNDPTIYQYTDTGETCSIGGGNNVQGPLPLADKRNVVIDFWAFGDSPYDYLVNTCLDDDGNPSTCNDCAVSNSNMEDLPYPNTCTFEGEDFECLKESIIPFMNRKMNGGDGAFQLHVGDILKGVPDGNSRRCTEASFDSRDRLFQPAKNFLLINGDNESNECMNYDIREASDPVRDMWREKFGKYSFASDFPAITGGGRPAISRVEGNEEIFGFEHKNIAFFGLDYPAGDTYITKHAPQDLNAKFVKESLASDTSCALRSIVLFSHSTPGTPVYEALDEYFEGMCGVLPTLAVLGNAHPSTYCLTKENEKLSLTVEAFQSGPVLVSVVRDPKEGGSDYFHVADSDLVNSNSQCPEFTTPSPTNAMTPAPTPNPASVTTPAPSNAPNTVPEPPTSTLTIVFSGDGDPPTPLPNCRGDCDNDDHCEGSLVCFHRSGTESVPSCQGTAPSGEDFCAERATEKTVWLKGNDGIPDENFPLGLCEGDCDEDSDCQLGLVCQQREGTETIPGCVGVPEPGEDYCRYPDLTMVGNPPSRKLRVCEGDCDVDSDCGPNLQCFQRPGTETVSGCLGTGRSGMDYCALRPTVNTLFLKGNNGSPRGNFPLGLCEGDCDGDDECRDGLVCMNRSGDEVVPGCIGIRTYGEDYCYDALGNVPTIPPGPQPTYAPNTFGATFVPGDLSQPCDGGKLMLSKGMDCRLLTTAGQYVQYDNGGQSDVPMHGRADGAAVIAHPDDGGWYYTSNSENGSGNGGVGTLRFNAQGEVIGYKMDLEGTTRNCGGGKTYWDTWVTCEEDGSRGFCWEVDPFTGHTAKTNAVIVGGNYESFAYDDQDPEVEARFFTTEDSGNGPLVRYTPAEAAFNTGNKYHILTSDGGTHDYLVLNTDGTFFWSTSESAGASSASTYFPNAEGIDVINRQLFFVSKVNKELFELDLAAGTWIVTSTVSGAFDKQPDQIQKVVGDSDFLYFCEDGGLFSDIHGRNKDGQFFTIVRGDGYGSETSGLAFSPDNKFMYVAFQGNSNVYAFWRQDGLDFGAVKADIKYHQT